MTYFLAGWTSNLGVDPLLRSLAFLLLPAFFFLLALLVSVCLVRETINPLPGINIRLFWAGQMCVWNLKEILVPKSTQLVKILSLIGYLFLGNQPLMAEMDQTILLSIGEMREVALPTSASFSVGNSDTISHKYMPSKQLLLVKGKKLGFSEILIWSKGERKKQSLKVHVIERRKHLEALKTLGAFESLGLETHVIGDFIKISGELKSLSAYQQFHQFRQNAGQGLLLTGTVARSVMLELIGMTYQTFHRYGLREFRCYLQNFDFICRTPTISLIPKGVLEQMQAQTFVKIIETERAQKNQNFALKMKLLQLERLSGEELHFGLDRLSANLGEVFDLGVGAIAKRNQFLLNNQDIDLSTLAEPSGLIRLGHPAEFRIGAEVPYQAEVNLETGASSKQWKFVGLKIKITLQREADQYVVYYETEFSTPGGAEDEFSGNSESSTAVIPLGQPIELFQIGMKTVGSQQSSMPLLSKVPLLGRLFQSKSESSTHKKITGLILLESHESLSTGH